MDAGVLPTRNGGQKSPSMPRSPTRIHLVSVSGRNEQYIIGNCYKMAKNLAKLCSSSSVLLKVELASSEIGYLAEAITKQWRRKWQHTPVFLPGESQGWGRLVGCPLWGRTESDRIEAT